MASDPEQLPDAPRTILNPPPPTRSIAQWAIPITPNPAPYRSPYGSSPPQATPAVNSPYLQFQSQRIGSDGRVYGPGVQNGQASMWYSQSAQAAPVPVQYSQAPGNSAPVPVQYAQPPGNSPPVPVQYESPRPMRPPPRPRAVRPKPKKNEKKGYLDLMKQNSTGQYRSPYASGPAAQPAAVGHNASPAAVSHNSRPVAVSHNASPAPAFQYQSYGVSSQPTAMVRNPIPAPSFQYPSYGVPSQPTAIVHNANPAPSVQYPESGTPSQPKARAHGIASTSFPDFPPPSAYMDRNGEPDGLRTPKRTGPNTLSSPSGMSNQFSPTGNLSPTFETTYPIGPLEEMNMNTIIRSDLGEQTITHAASNEEANESESEDEDENLDGPEFQEQEQSGSDFLEDSDAASNGDDDEISDTDSVFQAHDRINTQYRNQVRKFRAEHRGHASSNKIKKPAQKKRRRGGIKGPRKIAELPGDIRMRLARATQFFLQQKYQEARREAQDIIRINGEVYQAYSLLASVFKEWGQEEEELMMMTSACHFMPKDEAGMSWLDLARRIDEAEPATKQQHIQSGVYYCSEALKTLKNNVEALCIKAGFNRELNHVRTATGEYELALKHDPHNPRAMRGLAECYLDKDKPELARKIYQDAITFYQDSDLSKNRFSWNELAIYLELHVSSGEYAEAIKNLKSLSRWILGRRDETYWDDITEDDREWDADDFRRNQVPEYEQDRFDLLTYGDGLPLELRTKLGVYRLKLENFQEAMVHFGFLETEAQLSENDDLLPLADLFHEAGDRLHEAGHFEEALTFYEIIASRLTEDPDFSHCLPMGKCYVQLDELENAERSFLTTLQNDEANIDARQELAKLYDGVDNEKAAEYRQEIRDLVKISTEKLEREAKAGGKKSEKAVKAFIERKPYKPSRKKNLEPDPNAEIRRQLEEERVADLLRSYETVQRCKAGLEAGDPDATAEWMAAAADLVADFRTCKGLYPYDKFYYAPCYVPRSQREKEKAMANANRIAAPDEDENAQRGISPVFNDKTRAYERRRAQMPSDHLGLSWDIWLDILVQYSLCLAKQHKYLDAYDVCISAKEAVIYCHDQEAMFTIYLCWCTCAMLANDMDTIVSQVRHFCKEHQFTTDAYRLFSYLVRLCQSPLSHLTKGPTTKFILRNIKTMDYSVRKRDGKDGETYDEFMGAGSVSYTARDKEGNFVVNRDFDICLLLLYGHILYVNTSFGKALHYLFRAHSLDPTNPTINMSIGLCYIQHAIKRQTLHRPYVLTQGISFLQIYYASRKNSPILEERQEAHYNMARMYHMLGLSHLALPLYESVLREEEEAGMEGGRGKEDLVVEAAFNLQGIFVVAGNMGAAKRVTDRWLVI